MALAKTTQDHEEIQKWAEARGGKPAVVAATESDKQTGILRLMFPNAPQHNDGALEEISWDEFFEKFDESGLQLIYQEETADHQISDFNKLTYPDPESPEGKKLLAKSADKKTAGKKTAGKKSVGKKTAVKKSPAKKTASTKATGTTAAKKSPAKVTAKTPATKAPAKTAAAKGTAAKPVPAKKAPAKKSAGKKATTKSASKKSSPTTPARNYPKPEHGGGNSQVF